MFASPNGRPTEPTAPTARQQRENERLVREPSSPDPEAGEFTLDEAVAGMPIDGPLVVEISTDLGTIFCDLDPERAPRTVANFIGLARGLRPYWDARAGQWVKRPYYRELTFHRVVPEFMVQGGDYLGDGSGTVGYTIPDENTTALHDRAGLLCMANTEPNKNGAQFFVTDGAAPHLDGSFTVFGRCVGTDVVERLARVPQSGAPDNRPLTELRFNRFLIRRVPGGAAAAQPAPPAIPPDLQGRPNGASAPPNFGGTAAPR